MFKPRIFGKYLLLEELGFGGIGEVYKAKTFGKEGYQNLVAIKTIRTVFSEEQQVVELFKNEAILSLSLDHKNIIRVFDYGKVKDKHYIAMEYIHGQDLRAILKQSNNLSIKFPLEYTIKIVSEVCEGLEYIHNKKDPRDENLNIVHRDISPSNILLSYPGEIKIIDFGVAKAAKDTDKKEDEEFFMGKLKYASPEQVSLEPIDKRSDIFATGILMYEMLTNQNPFAGNTEVETVTQIKEARYEIPSHINPEIPVEMETIIGKTLAKDPVDRYQSANDLSIDLQAFAETNAYNTEMKDIVSYMENIFREDSAPVRDNVDDDDKTLVVEVDKMMIHEDLQRGPKEEDILSHLKQERKNVATLAIEVGEIETDDESMDPDEIAAIMNEVFKRIIDVIYRFDGQIDQLLERQVLAIFGVPKSHDNDIERAIVSGLSINNYIKSFSNELKININIKLSVDYGDVIVDYSKSDVNKYSVKGNAVDSVYHLLKIAPTNVVLGGEEITKYGEFGFNFEKAGSYFSKNIKIPYYKINDRRTEKRDTFDAKKYISKFVGRNQEFAKLYALFCQAKEGIGQVISIFGDIGIGKTRLVHEFISKVKHENVLAIESNARPIVSKFITSDISYSLLLILIKKIAHIDDDDSEGLVKNKLLSLCNFGVSKNDVYLIATLFSIEFKDSNVAFLEGDQFIKELFLALKKLFSGIAETQNLVIIFDDMQWADQASFEFIDYFVKNITSKNIMTICVQRKDQKVTEWDDLDNYNTIELGPLSGPESLSLLQHLLPNDSKIGRDFLYTLMEQTEGNPLFLEEIAKAYKSNDIALKESNMKDISIPKTLQGILTARLDRLDDKSKTILRYASVIGKNFRQDLLTRVINSHPDLKKELGEYLEEGLSKLIKDGLIIIIYERDDLIEFTFKHSMTFEVVYNSMLEEMHAQVHGSVGESIESLFEDRIEEHYEILSRHFELSGDLDKCIHYYELSGEKLQKAYINKEALECYHKCVIFLKKKAEKEKHNIDAINQKLADIYNRAGMIYYYTSDWDRGLKIFNLALKVAKQIGEIDRHAFSLLGLARIYKAMGNYELALKLLSEAISLALKTDDMNLIVEIKREMGGIHYFLGNIDMAIETIEEGLEEATELGDESIVARYQNDLGMIYCKKERYEEALKSFYTSLKYKEKVGDKYGVGVTLGNIVDIYFSQKNFDEALKYGEAALKTTREIDDSWGIAINLHNLGNIYIKKQIYDKAETYFKESYEISNEIGWDVGTILNNMYATYLSYREGIFEKGIVHIQNDILKAQKIGNKESIARGNYLIGLLYFEKGKKKEMLIAKDYFKKAFEIADEIGLVELIESIKEKIG
ncbi:MAG: protein kinase [Pseudomonadota bacterium]